jgi:hypothetical protein
LQPASKQTLGGATSAGFPFVADPGLLFELPLRSLAELNRKSPDRADTLGR